MKRTSQTSFFCDNVCALRRYLLKRHGDNSFTIKIGFPTAVYQRLGESPKTAFGILVTRFRVFERPASHVVTGEENLSIAAHAGRKKRLKCLPGA
jgi:hypothetical protein